MKGPLVPWNAGWTSEERFEVRPCRYVQGALALWQPHTPGIGKPIFATPHTVRQRRSIAEMRCTVCGERTQRGDRWWFELRHQIAADFTSTESPVHRHCADWAAEACPHLRRLGRAPKPMPGGYRIIASIVGGDAVARDFGIEVGRRRVFGSLKLAWPMLAGKLCGSLAA